MARELSEKYAIRNLQRYLRQLALTEGVLPELPIDGVYDSETRFAVEEFQRVNGLPITGEADRNTWDAIYLAYLDAIRQNAKPNSVDIFYRQPTPTYIQNGDVGFQVVAVQYMLNEVLLFYGDTMEVVADGRYNESTIEAVRNFQQYTTLPQTGVVDLETWNRLSMLYNDLFQNGNQ